MELFNKLARSIKYDYSKKAKDTMNFMEELHPLLKSELLLVVYKRKYMHLDFFLGKDESFIIWTAQLLKPHNYSCSEYFYKEFEEVKESK